MEKPCKPFRLGLTTIGISMCGRYEISSLSSVAFPQGATWWFSNNAARFRPDRRDGPALHYLYEKTKAPMAHYRDATPRDARLKQLAIRLKETL